MAHLVRLLLVVGLGTLLTACPESGEIGKNPDPPEEIEEAEEVEEVDMEWLDAANEVCVQSSERVDELAASAASSIPEQTDPGAAFTDQLEMSSDLFESENEALEALEDPSDGLAFVTEYLEQRRAVAEDIVAAVAAIDWSARLPALIEVDEGFVDVNQASLDLGLVECAPPAEQADSPIGPYSAFRDNMAQSFEVAGFSAADTPCLLDALETALTEGTIVDPFAPTAEDAAALVQACGITAD